LESLERVLRNQDPLEGCEINTVMHTHNATVKITDLGNSHLQTKQFKTLFIHFLVSEVSAVQFSENVYRIMQL
jgi:hypothetical protein